MEYKNLGLEKLGLKSLDKIYRNLSIEQIIKNFSNVLNNGFVITIDYGDTTEKLVKKYKNSSIQTYSTHTKGNNPYTKIGKQDITTSIFNIIL